MLCLLHWEPPTGAPPLPSCHNGYLGRLYNRGYVNLPAALVLNCWLAGLDYVDCFRRLHQMLQICTENTPTGARAGTAWRIPIAGALHVEKADVPKDARNACSSAGFITFSELHHSDCCVSGCNN